MSNLFFVSDTHYGHANVLKHSNYPFKTIEEHDETIITNWNAIVKPNDIVYHLGDFCLRNVKPLSWYLNQLNGQIHLIRGNHDDKEAWKQRKLFASAEEAKYLRHENEKIYLLHYACRTWRNSHHGSWHLYGHSHGDLKSCTSCHTGEGKSLDVWVGGHDYKPWSFDEVKAYMANKKVTYHHEEEEEECPTSPE